MGCILRDVVKGDFGESLQFGVPALEVVLDRLGNTLELVAVALGLAVILGIAGGAVAALRRDSRADFLISFLAVLGQSMPSFWLEILLIQFFALRLGWLPTSGPGRRGAYRSAGVNSGGLSDPELHPHHAWRDRNLERAVRGDRRPRALRRRACCWSTYCRTRSIQSSVSRPAARKADRWLDFSTTESIFAWPGIGRLMVSSISRGTFPW